MFGYLLVSHQFVWLSVSEPSVCLPICWRAINLIGYPLESHQFVRLSVGEQSICLVICWRAIRL